MIKVKHAAFTGYPVTDMKRARAFYEGVLGLKMAETFGDPEETAWVEYDLGSHTLAISNMATVEEWPPSKDGPSLALEVEDLDAALTEVQEREIPIILPMFETEGCRMFIVTDPDGNSVALHQLKS